MIVDSMLLYKYHLFQSIWNVSMIVVICSALFIIARIIWHFMFSEYNTKEEDELDKVKTIKQSSLGLMIFIISLFLVIMIPPKYVWKSIIANNIAEDNEVTIDEAYKWLSDNVEEFKIREK